MMHRPKTLRLDAIHFTKHQLVMRCSLDELRFQTVYWSPDTHLEDLEHRFGKSFLERLFVHAALFEINKIVSLRPQWLDLGPYAHHHTVALETLWTTVIHHVWAQWRFENNLPDEPAPQWMSEPSTNEVSAVTSDRSSSSVLLFCGGGKDSLVSMKLLERAQIPFASFAYTSSVYGRSRMQQQLVDRLLDHGKPQKRHRQIVMDDFFDAPVLELLGPEAGVHTVTAAETPSSIFAALPILLAHGYSHAVLGHEASANRGNLIWSVTGEEVNHQWGKSLAAQQLLNAYIRTQLVSDVGVFGILMPIFDVVIFELLRMDETLIGDTHSCNVAKPWCQRCPKCAYVWLSYRAHLSREPVDALFSSDLLERPENRAFFQDMMGLGVHTPFECIGQIEESRLALSLCGARGLLGPFGLDLLASLPAEPVPSVLDRYTSVAEDAAGIPLAFAELILPQMKRAAMQARQRITNTLGQNHRGCR